MTFKRLGTITEEIVKDAEWKRDQELSRSYDGPIPPQMKAREGDGELRLELNIAEAEGRAKGHDEAAEAWLKRGNAVEARRNREDAQLARNTAAINRDALDKLRADKAWAMQGGEGEVA